MTTVSPDVSDRIHDLPIQSGIIQEMDGIDDWMTKQSFLRNIQNPIGGYHGGRPEKAPLVYKI
jgi:hypothetical protein